MGQATRTPIAAETGSALLDRYAAVRATTERLVEPLAPEDCVVQSMTEASPVKWNVAHTTWFFEQFVLVPGLAGYRVFHPRYSFLFNSYYDGVGERVARDERGLLTRPSLEEVRLYRRHVDRHVRELLASEPSPELARTIEVGLNHEQQHQELLLTDLKHALSRNPLRPAYLANELEPRAPTAPLSFSAFEGGLQWIGHAGEGFAFDNETPRHRVFIEPFELASRTVTNAEYLAFVEDGGYREPRLWLSDGWAAVQARGWETPLYWERRDGEWWTFTLHGPRRLEASEPVTHVSYYEADAFATWADARLATEQEWELAAADRAARGHFLEPGRAIDGAELHPRPAPRDGATPSALFGDVWEWTQSAYAPYPGFRTWEGTLGEYNGKFMSNQMVLRGGSCVSPAGHLRASYRNFFYPDARWQFSGIRLARSV
jgi:ergothioneine biosynthesis protein EgtB